MNARPAVAPRFDPHCRACGHLQDEHLVETDNLDCIGWPGRCECKRFEPQPLRESAARDEEAAA